MPTRPILKASKKYIAQLDAGESAALERLLAQYAQSEAALQAAIDALAQEYAGIANLTGAQAYRLERYRSLQKQVAYEMDKIGKLLGYETIGVSDEAARLGVQAGINLGTLSGKLAPPIVDAFASLNTSVIARASSFVGTSSPLYKMLAKDYGAQWAEVISMQYVNGVSLGWNSKKIARMLSNTISTAVPSDMQRIIRTAQNYTYRTAQQATWQESGVVSGWIWSAETATCCASCLAQHGSIHGVDEMLDDHFNGRCLVEGTLISTLRGDVSIENIKVGDYVLTHTGNFRRVTNRQSRLYNGDVITLMSGVNAVTLTPEHRVLTQRGWVEAQDVIAADILRSSKRDDNRESSLRIVQPSAVRHLSFLSSAAHLLSDYDGYVYDLTVDRDSSFVASGIVVHNCAQIPITDALPGYPVTIPDVPFGEDIFNSLSSSAQAQRAADGGFTPLYNAYKDGAITFAQMSGNNQDDIFGNMRIQNSLSSLLGDGAQKYYQGAE